MAYLNLAHIVDCTESEGPGKRLAMWVQGCLLRCKGCCNEQMQPIVPAEIVSIEELAERIRASLFQHSIEGITLLGGEPMLQAKGLSELANQCQRMGLSVMTFTGYTLEFLKTNKIEGAENLINQTDILVDGPFVKKLASTKRNWVGSDNQNIHYLTDRYSRGIEFTQAFAPSIEFRIKSDGTIESNGWPFDLKIL